MDLPLELTTRSGVLHVDATADDSSTQLLLTAGGPVRGARLELGVRDVQDLAGALLEWLVGNDHELPLLALELMLTDEDEDEGDAEALQRIEEDSRPPAQVVPEHTR